MLNRSVYALLIDIPVFAFKIPIKKITSKQEKMHALVHHFCIAEQLIPFSLFIFQPKKNKGESQSDSLSWFFWDYKMSEMQLI